MNRLTTVLRPTSYVLWAVFACLLMLLAAPPGLLPGARAVPGDIAGAGHGVDEPDGFVGISDLNRVLGNWNVTCDPGDWTKGDIDGDGFVGTFDLGIVLAHFNQTDPDPFLGTNLGPIEYWKSHWVFVDVFKMAREWQMSGGATSFTTDSDAWPETITPSNGTVFSTIFSDLDGVYPGGNYVLTYEGTADVTVTGDVTSVTLPDPGNIKRKLVAVTPDNQGIRVNVTNISVGDPIKNIRLWMPGFENAASPFHPLFISRLEAFKVIRFMDWQKINGSNEVDWVNDRKKDTHAFQNDNAGGVALEYMIELCNLLEADPWFCMPHKADNNYVTQFATQVKNDIHSNATIYVEYSNELWNSGFSQFKWLFPPDGLPTGAGGNHAFFIKWATEAANDFTQWSSVFSNDHDRLVRVIAGHKNTSWITNNVLKKDVLENPTDPVGNGVLFDAVACSTYFYKKLDTVSDDDAEGILDNAIQHIPNDDAADYQAHAGLAQDYSVNPSRPISFISYEGGQHYVPNDPNSPTLVTGLEMQRHPKMYVAYLENIWAFVDSGGSLYMAFNTVGKFTDKDTFGHFEYQDESINDAPKHRALIGGGGRTGPVPDPPPQP